MHKRVSGRCSGWGGKGGTGNQHGMRVMCTVSGHASSWATSFLSVNSPLSASDEMSEMLQGVRRWVGGIEMQRASEIEWDGSAERFTEDVSRSAMVRRSRFAILRAYQAH